MKTLQNILAFQNNYSKKEKQLIAAAYTFAKKAHKGQKLENTTTPYFTHPAESGWLLSKWRAPSEAVCAGLLHDTIEDCEISFYTLRRMFGVKVAFYVDAISWYLTWEPNKGYTKNWQGFFKKLCTHTKEDPICVLSTGTRSGDKFARDQTT